MHPVSESHGPAHAHPVGHVTVPPAPGEQATLGPGQWRKELAGGFNAALVGLPVEMVFGVLAVAPLGVAFAESGLRAALWACVIGGLLGFVLRTTGGMITGTRAASALILSSLATALLQDPRIRGGADPAQTVFLLLLACTVLAGVFQSLSGLIGVGKMLKYVPYPVVAGLMCGVGFLILRAALKPMLGLPDGTPWSEFAAGWHPLSVIVAMVTFALCMRPLRWTRPLPASLVGLLGGCLVHQALAAIFGAEHLGPTFGSVQSILPSLTLVDAWRPEGGLGWLATWLPVLLPHAVAIAAFLALETVLCLATIEAITHERREGDRELVLQGLITAMTGSVGGTPAAGNPARIVANLQAGGRMPLSNLFYALAMVALVLFVGQALRYVPVAATAGLLLQISLAMFDDGTRRMARLLLRQRDGMPAQQYRTLLASFSVIVLVALVANIGQMIQALAVGVVLAVLLFVKSSMKPIIRQVGDARVRRSLKFRTLPDQNLLDEHGSRIVTIELDGPLFFGTADRAALEIERAAHHAWWIVLDLRRVTEVDATGARTLARIGDKLEHWKKHMLMCGMDAHTLELLSMMGMAAQVRRRGSYGDLDAALEAAEDELLTSLGSHTNAAAITLTDTVLAEGLSAEQVGRLEGYVRSRVVEAGETLFRRGDSSASMYVAAEGAVDIVLDLGDGTRKRLACLAPGNVFGEMALLDGAPRSADAVMLERSLVWELTTEAFREIEQRYPEISTRLLHNLSNCLAQRLRVRTRELSALLEHR